MRWLFVLASLWVALAVSLRAVTQIDCSAVFNARPVSSIWKGHLVPWNIGIDGEGKADGFATVSAARAMGDPSEHALPDDGKFSANHEHPLIQLPYGQAGATRPQARGIAEGGSFVLALPAQPFSELFLFFTSAEGASQVSVTLYYSDGPSVRRAMQIPDYYRAPDVSEKALFALASDLAKWNAAGKLAEPDHHYIYGWKLPVDPAHRLKQITVAKTAPGYLVFWGASAAGAGSD